MGESKFNRFNSYKILVHAGRLRAIAAGEVPYPIDWHIYPSNICNHSCAWCMFRQNGEQFEHREMLDRELLFRAVEDAGRTGATLIHFSGGGEPLLNKHTLDGLRLASRLRIATALSTNGTYLDGDVAAQTDFIRVSVNAGTKEQHQATNHADDSRTDWEIVLRNIQTAVAHKRKDIGLAFVVDHENWRDIYPFCQLAAETRVDFVHIRPAFWYDSSKNSETRNVIALAASEAERAKTDFGDKVSIFAVNEKFNGYWTPRSYHRCYATYTGTCLTATGEFAVCQDRTDLRFGFDYKHGKTFEEVWHSDEHVALVQSIASPGKLDTCPRCVWNNRNELIDEMFIKDSVRLELI